MSSVKRYFVTFVTNSINDVRITSFPTRAQDPAGGVDRHSGVFATVTEVSAPPGGPLDFPFQGEAMLSIWNIVPQDNGTVEFVIRVQPDFFSLNVRVQFLVCND